MNNKRKRYDNSININLSSSLYNQYNEALLKSQSKQRSLFLSFPKLFSFPMRYSTRVSTRYPTTLPAKELTGLLPCSLIAIK